MAPTDPRYTERERYSDRSRFAAGADNTATASAVRERLIQEGTVEPNRVQIQDDRGTVYLNGTVDSASQKMRAEQVATGTPGVSQVINQLQIAPAAGTAPLGTAMSDERDRQMAAGGGSCTFVAKIAGTRTEPKTFGAVQVRVYDDASYQGAQPSATIPPDSQPARMREERTIQQGDRIYEERRMVEERPAMSAGNQDRDARGNVLWTGWIKQGDRVSVPAPRGRVRYDYRYAADDRFHGDKTAWCGNGAQVNVP
jgi:hypothetical protein